MPEAADISDQQELLHLHRRTVQVYLRRRAMVGAAHEPPEVAHGIASARQEIAQIKATLRGWGVDVPDLPDDTERAEPTGRSTADDVRELLRLLATAGTAFQAQSRLRTRLVRMVCVRLGIPLRQEFETFFLHYYDLLTAEERFLHQRLRALTATIQRANTQASAIAERLMIDGQVPSLQRLREHLAIWLDKYEHVFLHAPHMALVYLAVDEGVGFPKNVEAELAAFLERTTTP